MTDDDSLASKIIRRTVSIPAYFLALLLWIALAPVVVPVAVFVDAIRGRRSTLVRFVLTIGGFLGCEMIGVLVAVWISSTGGARDLDRNYRLQWWWAGTLLDMTVRLFAMTVEVEGEAFARGGPVLVLLRHASTGDTLIPAAILSRRASLRLRYVIKRELLWDPCLDLVGHRVPNAFVRRGSRDPEHERSLVAALAKDLGPNDGVLIYPEGTRFTPKRRDRAISSIKEAHPELAARAEKFSEVLPPRLGGSLALLRAAPEADVLFVAHHGFDGVRRLSDVMNGALLGRTIAVCLRRVAARDIPTTESDRASWLYDEWQKVDAWVAARKRWA